MFPIINIGPLAIQAAGFILILSFFLGTWLTRSFAQGLGTNTEAIENSILYGLLAGILGARIGFMLKTPSLFVSNPLSLLSLTPSMLDTSFGLLVGILTSFILAQKKHLPLWPTLDSMAPFFVLIFMGIHLANYANGDAYGIKTDLPWGIFLWNAVRHPVQLYAVLLGALLFVWLLTRTRLLRATGFRYSGVLFAIVFTSITMILLFTRAFSAEKLLLGSLDFYQLLFWTLFLGGLGLLYTRAFPQQKKRGIIISMGSNIDPKQKFLKAEALLSGEFRIRQKSSLYLTKDVKGHPEAKPFLNRVIEIESDLNYMDLVARLKTIEIALGRQPGNKIQVALDLDVLTFGSEVFVEGRRRIPEPDMLKYHYLAIPLAEMSPDFRHPASGLSIQDILEKLTDNAQIQRVNEVENGIET